MTRTERADAGDAPGTIDAAGAVSMQGVAAGAALAPGTGDALASAVVTFVAPEADPSDPEPGVAIVGAWNPMSSAAAPVVSTTRPMPRRRRACRPADVRGAGGAARWR